MEMPTFEAPGPGPWELEGAHFPRPFPKFGLEGVIRGFTKGFAEGTARYGILLSHFEIRIVNGFWYQQPAAFGAPPGAKGPPPKPILWLLTRLHPGMRKRIKTSGEAFANKRWRSDLEEWDTIDKPGALSKHEALLAVEPSTLDDAKLVLHLRACERHLEEMLYLHHKYTVPCCVPIGDFLAHVSDWTGRDAGEVLGLLRGSSKISLGFSNTELEALASAIRDDEGGRALLAGGDGARGTLDALRSHAGAIGVTARTFLDRVEHRAVTYDVGERSSGEMPEMLVGAIRAVVDGKFDAGKDDVKERVAALRKSVPEAHQARFDELLAEARHVSRLRDERGLYADCWAIGIARRALLELGRRLVAKERLAKAEHAVDLTGDEAESLLLEGRGPSAAEVAERVTWRTTKTVADAPAFLGGEPAGPPDPSILPPAARRATRAVDAVLTNLFKDTTKTSTAKTIRGIAVNQGVYEGTARLVVEASEFHRIEQGDVLVTRSTAPYFNVVLPLLGAIVTDRGGQLCHAAIVAREYGIPGIVGTKEATRLIPDGARVRVDGSTGEVTVLGA